VDWRNYVSSNSVYTCFLEVLRSSRVQFGLFAIPETKA